MDRHNALERRTPGALVPRDRYTLDVQAYPAAPDPQVIWTRGLSALRRRWRTAVILFVTVMGGVAIGTYLRTPTYRATGLIEIRPESTQPVSVETLFGPQEVARESLATQFGILRSRTLADRVVDTLALDQSPEFAPAPSWPLSWLGDEPAPVNRERVIDAFQQKLTVGPQEDSRLVRVSFDASDPALAARVVNAVLDGYLKMRVEDAQRTVQWLEQQIADARQRVERSQQELQAYVRAHGLQVFETGQGETENLVNGRLQQLHTQLAEAQAQRFLAQSAYEQVNRQGAGGAVSSPVTESLSVRLAELQRDAAGLAASFHEQYPKLVEVRRQIQAVQRAIDEETRNVVTRAQRTYQAALRHEGLIQSTLNEQQRTAQALEGSSAGYAALRRAVAADEQLFTTLDQKLKDVSISTALQATNAGVVDHARPPLEPYQSPLALNFAVGLMLALIAGVGGALVRERFDRSVRRLEDVDGLMGVPAMAAIPAVPSRQMRAAARGAMPPAKAPIVWATPSGRGRSWQPVGSAGEHQSALSDAFAALRAAVLVRREAEGSRSLLVTSTSAGDGKTTVSVNLALSLARLNQRVLLIDADLRHPCVHEALRLGNEAGLASYLAGEIEWRAAVTPDVAPNFDVLTTRRPGTGPGDLLASSAMRRLLQEASALYDFVVVDSPPAMVYMPDARILAGLTDGVLLTVRGGSTARETVWQAVSQLKNVVGIVVNHFDVSESPYYHAAWTPDPRPFAN